MHYTTRRRGAGRGSPAHRSVAEHIDLPQRGNDRARITLRPQHNATQVLAETRTASQVEEQRENKAGA